MSAPEGLRRDPPDPSEFDSWAEFVSSCLQETGGDLEACAEAWRAR